MSYDIKFRRHVLKVWAREGLSFVGVGERFGISKQTVYNWTKRLEEKKNRLRPAIKIDMDKLKQPQLRLRMQFEQGFKGRFIISDLVIDQAR